MSLLQRIRADHAPAAVILLRLMVGGVFLSEGIQKFVVPDLGACPLHEDRHSGAAVDGAVCRRGRDHRRRPGHPRPVYPARRAAALDQHFGGAGR